MYNELKVCEIQKSLIHKRMQPKRELARKKIIDDECKILFDDILKRKINNMKEGYR